jgi:hypothetical protein
VNWRRSYSILPMLLLTSSVAMAQQMPGDLAPATETIQGKVDRLAATVAQVESELEASQRQIQQLRQQIAELQADLSTPGIASLPKPPEQEGEDTVVQLSAAVGALREQEDMQQTEIAVHEQTKVESESKFPVKLTGLVLMNFFSNSSGVDVVQSPTVAANGSGTTGLSLRQSVFGLDARGPHLFGGTSAADVRVDFFGGLSEGSYTNTDEIARLRTAHAEVSWESTRAFFAIDRPIVNPNAPTSLTAVAQPALSWSGNLWNWVPQLGVEDALLQNSGSRFTLEGALADIPDPVTPGATSTTSSVGSLAEQSRWLASEARIGYSRGDRTTGLQLGAGGYFSPHSESNGLHFDAWAATVDYRVPLIAKFEASGSLYRGSALGGLGGGDFKDYLYKSEGTYYSTRPLDDVGGWTQLKARAGERLEFNAAYGIDNAFSGEIRGYLNTGSSAYQNLARNSTVFGNVIFSPTAYTLFSLEYRRIDSAPAVGLHSVADVYGVATGYRF